MKSQKAFTLLELIIAMSIISVLMVGVFAAFSIALRIFVDESNRTDIYTEADRGMTRIVKELREAREIVAASSREVIFWISDQNGNGTREADETVSLSWSGTTGDRLLRTVSAESFPLAYSVSDLSLTYDDPYVIRLINISLSINRSGRTATLKSSVDLRNIGR